MAFLILTTIDIYFILCLTDRMQVTNSCHQKQTGFKCNKILNFVHVYTDLPRTQRIPFTGLSSHCNKS